MALEHWDQPRRKWILYRTQQEHGDDCARYPFVQIPARVFLDTNVVNLLVKHRETIFELGQMPSTLADARTNEIEALTHIFQVGQRANWDLVASAKTIEEISRTQDPGVRDDLLDYVRGLVEIDTEDSKHAASLGRRLMDASIVSILRDRSDRELLGNAIGLGCDAFCTCDHKTIVDKRDLLPKLPLRILTPVEWWKHIKPWAGLWC